MKLSEQPEYLAAIPAAYSGDFDTARRYLLLLLSRAEDEADHKTTGYILQVVGDIEARAGNYAHGHILHERAIALDPISPLPLLLYAKGLYSAFHEPAQAVLRIEQVESLISSSVWTPCDDEPDRNWYQQECRKLRASIDASVP